MEELKIDYIRNTSHGSKIYCIDGQEIIENIQKIESKINSKKKV